MQSGTERADWESDTGDLLEEAWILIANAGWDGLAKTPGWQEAAVRWRDRYVRDETSGSRHGRTQP